MNGSWHATLTSTASPGDNSSVDVFIIQQGTALSAVRIFLTATCSNESTMSGSVKGNAVDMTITGNSGDTATLAGTVSGTTLSGNYSTKTSGCGIKDDSGL
jgi:hypothetical protein